MSNERFIANMMRRLKNEYRIATPSWIAETDEYREIKERGLMQFHEWPSGHWDYTEKGRNFLLSVNDEAD